MPEGDTIYRSARAMRRAIEGKTVVQFETGLAPLQRLHDDTPVTGRVVEKVESRGKWLLVWFSGDLILVTHMLMSGSWHLYRGGERWWMGRDRMRVALTAGSGREGDEQWQAVAFNVPIAEFHTARSLERSSAIPRLGADVLGESFTVETGVERLRAYGQANPKAEIAVVLLNQQVLAGLGNVYKSEVAFAAGVNPFRAMETITEQEMEVMVDRSLKWLKVNVLDGAGDGIVTYSGNRRTTGNTNREERLWVYGRQGQECRRCGATVQMRKQGEQARSTYWCSGCQPWIAAPGQSAESPVGRQIKLKGPRRKVGC